MIPTHLIPRKVSGLDDDLRRPMVYAVLYTGQRHSLWTAEAVACFSRSSISCRATSTVPSHMPARYKARASYWRPSSEVALIKP